MVRGCFAVSETEKHDAVGRRAAWGDVRGLRDEHPVSCHLQDSLGKIFDVEGGREVEEEKACRISWEIAVAVRDGDGDDAAVREGEGEGSSVIEVVR